ncbi:galactose-1-phosphate uridylyltransferase [Nephila pilipes]|uniref:Galactose-1-phosphate uridylyltransferase n=1 Tax=Nephila pilipes TaxID=299642 RepID=A0A8X6Q1N1_NEPPI|nr:galactose-1-phosphate uridylyltransferase [Nephila pilipes]
MESQGMELSRLFISDKESPALFLIDCGADISVIPSTHTEKRNSNKLEFIAAKGTRIETCDQKLLHLNIGLRRTFNWIFVIGDVNRPIIGTDFLSHFKLLIDSKNHCLIHGKTSLTTKSSPRVEIKSQISRI